jgi:hypothetical protein
MSDFTVPPGAFWIGPTHPFDLHEVYICFRRVFTCDASPGTLYITADSRYKLWVNGELVGRGPARCWPHAQAVDALDLATIVRPGQNVLAVQVYQPGYSHFAYVYRGAVGLLAWLVAGDKTLLVTDSTWRVRRDPSFAPLVPRVSIYGSGVEDHDLHFDEDWHIVEYDDHEWASARVVAPPLGYPWTRLELRSIPLLVERRPPIALLETRAGLAPKRVDPHATLVAGWDSAELRELPRYDDWSSVRQGVADAAYWLFDLGRDYLCQGWVEVKGATGGEMLLLSYAEKIGDGRIVLSDPATYCRMRPTDRFILRAGDQSVEPFLLRGGRYLLFALIGETDLRLRFGATAAEYPLTNSYRLEASDPLLQGVISLCETTFRACLHDGFVDSVWRESSQWVGDALPQALVMASMSDDTRPLRRVIHMAAQGAYPDGILPSVLPGEVHAYTVTDYNFTWVELLALYWQLTGDQSFLGEHWATLKLMLDRFHADVGADGLIRSQPGRRMFLDWSSQSRAEPSAVYNLHYLLALQLAGRLAVAVGEGGGVCDWQKRAAELQGTARRTFWRANRWHDDPYESTYSQLAAALAILTGAAEADELPALLDELAARSLNPDDSHAPERMVLASPFMHHYVLEALRLNGRADAVLAIIRRRWGRWVEAGYPTTWENWDVDFPDGSQCHAFSAHPRYHLQQIALMHPELGVAQAVSLHHNPRGKNPVLQESISHD